jgi:hypothetical protein
MSIDPLALGENVLVVQIEGGGGEPERILRIAPPKSGRVLVHEWTSTDASDSPPSVRETEAQEILALVERAARSRRRMSEELYRIRRWLAGEG